MKRLLKVGAALALLFVVPQLAAQARGSFGTLTFTLTLHVRDAMGAPLPVRGEVRLSHSDIAGIASAMTGVDGIATLYNVPYGEFGVEVTAPGYIPAHEILTVLDNATAQHFYISMRREGETINRKANLTGKPRKELDLAIAGLRADKVEEADKHVQYALKHGKDNAEVLYVAALCAIARKDMAPARQYLESAVKVAPAYVGAQMTLGGLLLSTEPATAITHLEKALSTDPNQWRGHWMMAEASLRTHDYAKAKFHANRAAELGKDNAAGALVTLAVAEAMAGDREAARTRLEKFVAQYPKDPNVPHARTLVARLTPAAASGGRTEPAELLPVSSGAPNLNIPDVPALHLPAGIDQTIPAVTDSVPCSLPQVLEGVARRSSEFTDALQRFSAKESIVHEEVNEAGIRLKSEPHIFDYTVGLEWPRPGVIAMLEMRNGKFTVDGLPIPILAGGVPAIGLVFHSTYSPDFQFTCEGLGSWHGQLAWQVRFEQRADKQPRIHNWVMGVDGKRYGIRLKGRAWIAATSYQLERVETEMMKPIPEIRLEYERMNIEYAPVRSGKVELWLPATAEIYTRYRERLLRQQHDYNDFTLFSVDSNEKIKQLKEPDQQ